MQLTAIPAYCRGRSPWLYFFTSPYLAAILFSWDDRWNSNAARKSRFLGIVSKQLKRFACLAGAFSTNWKRQTFVASSESSFSCGLYLNNTILINQKKDYSTKMKLNCQTHMDWLRHRQLRWVELIVENFLDRCPVDVSYSLRRNLWAILINIICVSPALKEMIPIYGYQHKRKKKENPS